MGSHHTQSVIDDTVADQPDKSQSRADSPAAGKGRRILKPLSCEICERKIALTFHHLIPRKMHRRNFFRRSYSREELNRGVYLCRLCHSTLHKLFDEMTLAKRLNSLDHLLAEPSIQAHARWANKQKRR